MYGCMRVSMTGHMKELGVEKFDLIKMYIEEKLKTKMLN